MNKENIQNITIKKEQMPPRLLCGQHNLHLKSVQKCASTSIPSISNVIPMGVQNVNNNSINYTSETNNGNESMELHQTNNGESLNLIL